MSLSEFRESFEGGVSRAADDKIERGLWSGEKAVETSRSEMTQLLPQGHDTPGFSFYKVINEVTGERVGETWMSVDTKGGRTHCWIHWIMIEPTFRRSGHARRTLDLIEGIARKAGAVRVGLHVLADNHAALKLYADCGFAPSSHRLAKRLAPSDRDHEGRR